MSEHNFPLPPSPDGATPNYIWGEVLAIFDSATPGGLGPALMNFAVACPAKYLPLLHARARVTDQVQRLLAERLAKIPAIPDRLELKDQGTVFLGYYHLRSSLPSLDAEGGQRNPAILWDMVDWTMSDAEISQIMDVSPATVMRQRRKRNEEGQKKS